MSQPIRKAVIPAAGLGTRFLPATKTVPKELLPIVDKPILLFIVEEAVRAGIEDIVLVAGRGKGAIEDFFDTSYELEHLLEKTGKTELLEELQNIKSMANIISIRQREALGLGHAVYSAAPIVGEAPFAVLLGDELMISRQPQPSAIGELCDAYSATGTSTVAVMEVEPNQVSKYGIIDYRKRDERIYEVISVVEKPSPDQAPSRMALPGRYVFDGKIFDILKNTPPGKNGEIQLTDAMTKVAHKFGMLAVQVQAQRYDAGDKFGYLKANIEIGLQHPETGQALREYLAELAQQL